MTIEQGSKPSPSGQMLQMIFRFYVNSGEHDFFVKRLKNMAVAAQSDVSETSIGRRGVSYSQ